MKLEVGMYVRTNDDYINKIKKVNQFNVLVYGRDLFGEELNIPNNEITKASYNIIDILEEGDYVNGYKVTRIGGTYHGRKDIAIYCDYQENEKTGKWIMIYDDEIKSIVTHEQMEQIAYKVGD